MKIIHKGILSLPTEKRHLLTYLFKNPIYYTIETKEDLDEFKQAISKHIKECLQIGWSKKDNIDWTSYEN